MTGRYAYSQRLPLIPTQQHALVCEENLWLNTDRQCDTLQKEKVAREEEWTV